MQSKSNVVEYFSAGVATLFPNMNPPHYLNCPTKINAFLNELLKVAFCFNVGLVVDKRMTDIVNILHTCELRNTSRTHLREKETVDGRELL